MRTNCQSAHDTGTGTNHAHPILILGIIALLMIGLLWIGQGTGTINWPQSSFMISQIQWAYYGAALAVVGLILIWRGRTIRCRKFL